MTSLQRIGRGSMTHFHEAGLVCGYLPPAGRQLVLTVDVEAFDTSRIELWCEAMAAWAGEPQKLACASLISFR